MDNGKRMQAYDLIKYKIIEGELPPLSDISEEELKKEFGTSRTPIRQALQKLANEGFVYVYPRKGTIVADISTDMIYWIYEVRELNEPYIARNACGILSQEWLNKIKGAFEALPEREKNVPAAELRRHYIELDNELHTTILKTCQNRFIKNMMETVYDYSHWLRVRTSMANKEYNYSIKEHLAIINAFLENDQDKVEESVKYHIKAAKEVAFKYYYSK